MYKSNPNSTSLESRLLQKYTDKLCLVPTITSLGHVYNTQIKSTKKKLCQSMDGINKQQVKGGAYSILRKTYQVLPQFSLPLVTVLRTELELCVQTIAFCSEVRTSSLSVRFQFRVHFVHVYNRTPIT